MLDALIFGLHLVSYHDTSEPRNNYNPGVYVSDPGTGLVVGAYRNSYSRLSVYLGATKSWEVASWEVAVTGSIASGYRNHPYEAEGPACPPEWQPRCYYNNGMSERRLNVLFAPSIATPWVEGKRARLAIIPPIGSSESVLHLSMEFRGEGF